MREVGRRVNKNRERDRINDMKILRKSLQLRNARISRHARAGWAMNDLARGNFVYHDFIELSNPRSVAVVAEGSGGAGRGGTCACDRA
jgi:hypothetical protein